LVLKLSLLAAFCLSLAIGLAPSVLVHSAEDERIDASEMKSLDELLAEITEQKEDIEQLEDRVKDSEGLTADILRARLDRIWVSMFGNTLLVARELVEHIDDNVDVLTYGEQVTSDLALLPNLAREALQRIQGQVVLPTPDLSTQELVVADQQLMRGLEHQDTIYRAILTYTEIADEFDLDGVEERSLLSAAVAESAANRSAFLEIAQSEVATLRPAVATLAENAELAARLLAVEARVGLAAKGLQDAVDLMSDLGLETRQYTQQVLSVTGEITTEVLDVGVVGSLLADWGRAVGNMVAEDGLQLLFRLLLVSAIVVAAYQIAKVVRKLVNRALRSSRLKISNLLHQMIVASARNLILILGFMIAISQLGISLGPLLAGLGIAGFIVGFALQDTLGNFASGLLILFYRPFDVGDFVSAGGVEGVVNNMSLVNTTFMTLDNQKLVVPNNQIWGSVIRNVTDQTTRRIDLVFGISYDDDIAQAERILGEIIASFPQILDDPEPMIRLHELGDSSVNFVVRPWVATEDYWETYWEITKQVKIRFDQEGLSIPYPQRDVHVVRGNVGNE
jgi:small conductance mechanosensitive channel